MLRRIRIIAAAAALACITLLLAGVWSEGFGWLAKIQFLPSVLRIVGSATILNIAVLAALVVLTLLFGRIYCSIICPFGILQDAIIALRRRFSRKRFRWNPERKLVRYTVLAAFVACLIAGVQIVVSLLAPYSAYGRVVRSVVGFADGRTGLAMTVVGLATLALIAACAWFWGRAWCSNVCPVGTVLGLLSRGSLLRVRVDESKCKACGACEHDCKAAAIRVPAGGVATVDPSRCIDCFDCLSSCRFSALRFSASTPSASSLSGCSPDSEERSPRFLRLNGSVARNSSLGEHPESGISRRGFLKTGAAVMASLCTATLASAATKPDGEPRLLPPGAARDPKLFHDKCTACGLCIAACPARRLRPSTRLECFLEPEVKTDAHCCPPRCAKCSEVCPTGAIPPRKKRPVA